MGEAGAVKYPTNSFRDYKIVYQKKKSIISLDQMYRYLSQRYAFT